MNITIDFVCFLINKTNLLYLKQAITTALIAKQSRTQYATNISTRPIMLGSEAATLNTPAKTGPKQGDQPSAKPAPIKTTGTELTLFLNLNFFSKLNNLILEKNESKKKTTRQCI